MARLLPLALVAALACATGTGVPTAETGTIRLAAALPADSFDVQAWLAEVRALEDPDYDSLVARSRRLADRLDAEAGLEWRRACDTYYYDESNVEGLYEPTDPEQEQMIGRGLMDVTPLGEQDAAVAILCNRGAYQGSWVLAHVEGDRVALVRTVYLDEEYRHTAFETALLGEPLFEPDSHDFTTFVRSRGPGDCGAFTRYRLYEDGTGTAEILEVRARACTDDIPDELPSPEEWPVVYPR